MEILSSLVQSQLLRASLLMRIWPQTKPTGLTIQIQILNAVHPKWHFLCSYYIQFILTLFKGETGGGFGPRNSELLGRGVGANWSNWLQRDLTYIELIDENEGVTALISATISWKVPSSLIAMAYTSISWKEAVGVMFG